MKIKSKILSKKFQEAGKKQGKPVNWRQANEITKKAVANKELKCGGKAKKG